MFAGTQGTVRDPLVAQTTAARDLPGLARGKALITFKSYNIQKALIAFKSYPQVCEIFGNWLVQEIEGGQRPNSWTLELHQQGDEVQETKGGELHLGGGGIT